MARPAADVTAPGLREMLGLLAPFPGRAAIAARVALICALTVLVTSAYGTPEAAISVYVVFFLNRPDRVTSVLTGVAMLLLVTVVIAIVFAVALFSLDYPMGRVLCIALTSFGLLYLTSASKLRPVGAILAMIIGFSLDELGTVPLGEAATRELLYAWLMVAIPVGVSTVVNLLIAPSPRRLAGDRLAARLRLAAARLRGIDAGRAPFDASLREGNGQIATWLKLSKLEGTSSAADLAALGQAASASVAILVAVDLADREPGARPPAPFVEPIATTLDDMADMLAQGGYPVDVELALPATDALPPLACVVVAALRDAIVGFTTPADVSATAPASPPPAAAPRGGFFLPDARTNPEHVRYALKTTAAAMFCYLLYQQLDWSGIHTCFITCYMVSLGSTAETVEKMTLRIVGCIVGALIGTAAIVFVTPSMTSAGELMAVVFAGAFVSGWVAFGSPRIAYAGLQIAFAFLMCVDQGASPAFDLTLARDRTIGILLGNVVVYLVFTRIWPVSIGARIDPALAALLDKWRRLTRIVDPADRRALAADALASGAAIAGNVGRIHFEPSWVRPGAAWIAARRRALDALRALEVPLFLLADRAPGDAAVDEQLARVSHAIDADADGGTRRARSGADDGGAPRASGDVDGRLASRVSESSKTDAAADAPAESAPVAADPARAALLALIDARLARIEEDVRDDVPKESIPHASI